MHARQHRRADAAGHRLRTRRRAAGRLLVGPRLRRRALDLLIDDVAGIWHLANRGAVTWAELARRAAEQAEVAADGIRARPLRELRQPAARPRYSVLGSERGQLLPTLDDALARYLRHRALAAQECAPDGQERRRNFRPWRYHQVSGWV